MYANFNKYDNKGRRLSIFGVEENENGVVRTYVFTCSKCDQFSKRKAWQLFENYTKSLNEEYLDENDEVPVVTVEKVDIVDNKPKKTFINWCNENFYQLKSTNVNYTRIFVENKNGQRTILKDSKPFSSKLSLKW